ncbi:MAG TPA: amidohydrolase family protein [Vicinamibacterales bacterium]|nr:amidohydrolase family protein [Vicinamibacterales bacterium]
MVALLAAPATEHATIRLHYLQKPIGTERYDITTDANGLQLTSDFDFTDRGGRVQLTASLHTAPDLTPTAFSAKGKSYRFVNVDSTITIANGTADVNADGQERRVPIAEPFFTVDGYAPFSVQMLLVRYWKAHGQPKIIHTVPGLPTNDVVIEQRGREVLRVGSKTVMLDRFAIDGVVWGRESLWLDESGGFAAAITRAGGLSFEGVREDLAENLGTFVQRGTRDRISDLQGITAHVPPLRSGAYAMTGATLIDGTGAAPIADATILVRDGRIADVGPGATVAIPDGVAKVDVKGRWIVPGLWDMHTHFTQIEWAPVYLAAGVTTVRDMGNEFEFITSVRDAIASTRALGPRMLLAGLIDGPGPNAFGVTTTADAREAARIVAGYHDHGFQQIKIYSLITPPIVEAITTAAHTLGMTVTGHVPNGMTIDEAVDRGMDQIAHLAIRGEAGSPEVTATIAHLKAKGTVIDPTQSWNELLGHALGSPVAVFQPGITKVPPPLNRIFSNAGAAGIDPKTARSRLDRGLRIVKALFDAGVPIVVGTDEGVPGHSVHREIELYVDAGLTPMQALQAATIVPARAMKLDRELGTIEKGKRADMVVLNADPLDQIRNIRSVRWTITDGRVYDAPMLWRSVKFQP